MEQKRDRYSEEIDEDQEKIIQYNPKYYCGYCQKVGHTEIYCKFAINQFKKRPKIYDDQSNH